MLRFAPLVAVGLLSASPLLTPPVAAQPSGPSSLLPPVVFPPENPWSKPKELLGKALFWDEQLSSSRTVSCGTCHMPSAGGADPRTLQGALAGALGPGPDGAWGTPDDIRASPGVAAQDGAGQYLDDPVFGLGAQVTPRRAPTVYQLGNVVELFVDGRARSRLVHPGTGQVLIPSGAALESQALEPFLNPIEMGHAGRHWGDVFQRLVQSRPLAMSPDMGPELEQWIAGRTYPALFAEVFGSGGMGPERIAMAIATYERMLWSDQAPVDDFLAGQQSAISVEARAGFDLFQAHCAECHVAPEFGSDIFANIGVRPWTEDQGRHTVSNAGGYGGGTTRGAFRVPSLRNVELRSPYFHNGSAQTLEEVVEFYDRGGDFHDFQASAVLPLGLSATEKQQLVAFLRTLTDPRVEAELPPFDRPLLFTETPERMPELLGPGAPGTGGLQPVMVAHEPGLLGASQVKLGLANALGGAPIVLGLSMTRNDPPLFVHGLPLHIGLGPGGGSNGPVWVFPGVTAGQGPGGGYATYVDDLPDEPALHGQDLFAQWFVIDGAAELGVAASQGLELRLFSGP